MKLARLRISRELFLAAIPLPDDVLILNGRIVDDQTLELEIEHESLVDVKLAEGEQPPLVTPTFLDAEIDAALDILRTSLRRPRFHQWGQYVDPVNVSNRRA